MAPDPADPSFVKRKLIVMGPISSISDALGMLRRRYPVMILVLLLGMVGTYFYVTNLEREYETVAVIQFDAPVIASDAMGAVSLSSAAQQLQLIEQRLMTRGSLTRMVERFDLFSDIPDLTENEKVAMLRAATTIQNIAAPQSGFGDGGRLSAILITVRLSDPELAATVANDFAGGFLTESTRAAESRATEALRFFREEEERIAAENRTLEAEISDFKVFNRDALPEGQEFRRDEISRIRETLREIERSILELESERSALETYGVVTRGDRTFGSPSGSGADLQELQLELAQAEQVLAPTNPQIVRLKARIEVLQQREAEQSQRTTERFLGDIDGQITLLETQRGVLVERLSELQVAMGRAPSVEVDLASRLRELTRLQERYAVVANQLASAESALSLTANQKNDEMQLLEPAVVPEFPVGPGVSRAAMMGVAASLALAFGAAFLLELRNPIIRTAGQLERQTGLRPVVSIPMTLSPLKRRMMIMRRLVATGAVAAALVGAVYLVVTTDSPLIARLVEETGTSELLEALGRAEQPELAQ